MNSKSLFELLKRDDAKVEIPKLQRDYAQGRNTASAKEVRKRFTTELWKVINGKKTYLTLDLVYGYDEDGCFIPIDGQQRLTTLWLLHWYIAFRCGKFKEGDTKKNLKKFTYETRVSSREFLSMLCDSDMAKFLEDNRNTDEAGGGGGQTERAKKLGDFIKNQTWFRSSWIQDPTITSMLTMINKFDELWRREERLNSGWDTSWDTLKSRLNNIKFYFADMKEWELGDDLYIKMNARGLPLTSFENFKSDLLSHYDDASANIPSKTDECVLGDKKKTLSDFLDGSFLDFFWKLAAFDSGKPLPDSLMMEFVNRYVITARILAIQSGDGDKTIPKKDSGEDIKPEDYNIMGEFPSLYTSFLPYQKLNKDRWDDLMVFFHFIENARKFAEAGKEELPWKPYWEAEGKYSDYLIPRYENEKDISPKDRCILAALYLFVFPPERTVECDERIDDKDYKALKDWMHICWNIVENVNPSGYGGMYQCIELLHALAKEVLGGELNIYRNLAKVSLEQEHQPIPERTVNNLKPVAHIVSGRPLQRRVLREEIEKAGKRSDTQTTEEERTKIDMADARFKGTIFFLFADGYNDTGFSCKWENFSKKWGKISEYIGEKILQGDKKKEGWVNFIYSFLHHAECDDDGKFIDLDTVFDYKNEKSLLTDARFLRMIDATLMDIPPAIEWENKRWRWTDDERVPRFAMLLSHTPLVKAIVFKGKKGRIQWHHDSWVIYAKNSRRNAEKILVGQYPAARCDTLSRIKKSVPNGEWITDDQGKAWYLWGFDTEFVLDNKTFVWSLNWWNHIRMKNSQGDESQWIPHRYVPDRDVTVWVSGEAETIVGKFLEENEWESPYKFRERLFNEFKDELSKEFPDKAVNVWSTRGNKYAGKQELSSPGDAEKWLACGIEVEKGSQRGLACICSNGNVVEYGMRRHPEDDNINGNPDFWWWSKSGWSGNTASYGGNDICNTIEGINTTFFDTSGELLRDKVRKLLVEEILKLIKAPTPAGATDSAPSTSIQN